MVGIFPSFLLPFHHNTNPGAAVTYSSVLLWPRVWPYTPSPSPGILKDRLNDNDTYNIQLPGTTAPLCACCQLFDRAPHALHLDVMSPRSYYSTAARTTEKYRRQHLNLFILFHLDSFYNSIPSCSQSDNRNHNDERIDFSFFLCWVGLCCCIITALHHTISSWFIYFYFL